MIPPLTKPFAFDDTIPGWLEPEEAEMLARLAQDKICLEIGAYRGRSTISIAQTAWLLHTIDPCWPKDDPQVLPDLWTNLLRHNLTDTVIVHVGKSEDMYPLKCRNFFHFKFIFIDGCHEETSVTSDLINLRINIDMGLEYLALHDYCNDNWPGVKMAADKLLGPPDLIVKSMGVYDFTERSLQCRLEALNANG
jgi:hypothetical protein